MISKGINIPFFLYIVYNSFVNKKEVFFYGKKTVEIPIATEFITLGQLLKIADLIGSGGEAKTYLAAHEIVVDGESDNRRGRKLRNQSVVEIEGNTYRIVNK
ncbi:MAG: S4 domain-containing protein YaaA [Erysipelotrichia bacterium]|jgi:S4 domain protein YaaA|nr:S4 domain-containing protein YaaA [Erysipelotrichia bacterium]